MRSIYAFIITSKHLVIIKLLSPSLRVSLAGIQTQVMRSIKIGLLKKLMIFVQVQQNSTICRPLRMGCTYDIVVTIFSYLNS